MQNRRIAALIPSFLGNAYSVMVFHSLSIERWVLNWKGNLKNWEILTVITFYVDGVKVLKLFIYTWFLLAFAICWRQMKNILNKKIKCFLVIKFYLRLVSILFYFWRFACLFCVKSLWKCNETALHKPEVGMEDRGTAQTRNGDGRSRQSSVLYRTLDLFYRSAQILL